LLHSAIQSVIRVTLTILCLRVYVYSTAEPWTEDHIAWGRWCPVSRNSTRKRHRRYSFKPIVVMLSSPNR